MRIQHHLEAELISSLGIEISYLYGDSSSRDRLRRMRCCHSETFMDSKQTAAEKQSCQQKSPRLHKQPQLNSDPIGLDVEMIFQFLRNIDLSLPSQSTR